MKIKDRRFKHGQIKTRLYRVWLVMRSRCHNPRDPQAHLYLNRGIRVCPEWKCFLTFKKWAYENGYRQGLYIDRANNAEGYNPKNCRWLSPQESAVNRRTTKLTWKKVREIRRLYKKGTLQKVIAKKFGVVTNHVSTICSGLKWREP